MYIPCACTCGEQHRTQVGVPINENGGGSVRGVRTLPGAAPPPLRTDRSRRANASRRRRATGLPQPRHEWTSPARTILRRRRRLYDDYDDVYVYDQDDEQPFIVRDAYCPDIATLLSPPEFFCLYRIFAFSVLLLLLLLPRDRSIFFFGKILFFYILATYPQLPPHHRRYIIARCYEPVRNVFEIRTTTPSPAPGRPKQQGGQEQTPVATVGGEGCQLWRWERTVYNYCYDNFLLVSRYWRHPV